jgi:aminoglycoside 3-N-acetyltransferase
MNLFYTKDNTPVSEKNIIDTLDKLKIWDTEYLYIHTGLSFGTPNPNIKKKELLESVLSIFQRFNVKNICFPTFTFSFCNGQDFDVNNSKTKMGSINDFARKMPNSVRSLDPLMSNVLIGDDIDLVTNLSKQSIGKGSFYDKLHERNGVKFLFFGTKVGACYTYMHYIEKMLDVGYRYDKKFTGSIIDSSNKKSTESYDLFVRYKNVYPGNGTFNYEDKLLQSNISQRISLGDSSVSILDEAESYKLYVDLITKNPDYFITPDSIHDFDKTFEVKNMIAL